MKNVTVSELWQPLWTTVIPFGKWILKANFGWKLGNLENKVSKCQLWIFFFSNLFKFQFKNEKDYWGSSKIKEIFFFFNLQTHWKTAFSFLSLVKRTIIWVIFFSFFFFFQMFKAYLGKKKELVVFWLGFELEMALKIWPFLANLSKFSRCQA